VSPETCWAIKKHWNNKFYYTVASCWFFLWDLYYDAQICEHQAVVFCLKLSILVNILIILLFGWFLVLLFVKMSQNFHVWIILPPSLWCGFQYNHTELILHSWMLIIYIILETVTVHYNIKKILLGNV